ncbi:MAG: IS110 family transposase [Acidimicrobiales bacterium]
MQDNEGEDQQGDVTGGVDTHGEEHVAAIVDCAGRLLGTAAFGATVAGYRELLRWMRSFGNLRRVGVEGTGAYGAGLARYLAIERITVLEVNRPNRQARRRRGKSDTTDATAAARAALNGEATGVPKAGDGPVEAIRALRIARRSAMKARTQAANQIRDLILTAPEELRAVLASLDTDGRVDRCSRFRPERASGPSEGTKQALRSLSRRHRALTAELEELDVHIAALCVETNPALLAARGVGPEVASALLVAAGDNPERMRTEASFAALCGVSPVEASSGKIVRHRLNQGGNREANNALWRIVMVRLTCDRRTQDYKARRTMEGRTDREIMRCLKRYVAREVFHLLTDPPKVPNGAELRVTRKNAGITLAVAADALGTWPTRISDLERGLKHNADLANRYQLWLDQHAA